MDTILSTAGNKFKVGRLVAYELPQTELLDLLALCTALTVNALPGTGAAHDANALAEVVGLDMGDWWEPTAAGYLNHVSKAQIVQVLKEAGPSWRLTVWTR